MKYQVSFLCRTFVIFEICIIIASCNNRKPQNITNDNGHYKLYIDSISIPLDSVSLSCYPVYDNFVQGEINYYVGYNDATHSLDVFDLDNQSIINHIGFDEKGPDGVFRISSFHWHNSDSIFIASDFFFYIVDSEGKVHKKISIIEENPIKEYGLLVCNYWFTMQYDVVNECVYFFNLYSSGRRRDHLKKSVISSVSLKNNKIKSLPIINTNHYIKNAGRVGYLSWVNFSCIVDNMLIYNYQYESNIYRIDLSSFIIEVFDSTSRCCPTQCTILDDPNNEDEWMDHSLKNPHFLTTLYDQWRNIYYRFIWTGIDTKNSSGKFNSFIDKPIVVTLLNDQFEFIDEIALPNYFALNQWFVTKKGLFLCPSNPKYSIEDFNHLKFFIYKISDV